MLINARPNDRLSAFTLFAIAWGRRTCNVGLKAPFTSMKKP